MFWERWVRSWPCEISLATACPLHPDGVDCTPTHAGLHDFRRTIHCAMQTLEFGDDVGRGTVDQQLTLVEGSLTGTTLALTGMGNLPHVAICKRRNRLGREFG